MNFVWKILNLLLNRETSIDSINTTAIGLRQSIHSTIIMTLARTRKKTIIITVIVEENSQHFVD